MRWRPEVPREYICSVAHHVISRTDDAMTTCPAPQQVDPDVTGGPYYRMCGEPLSGPYIHLGWLDDAYADQDQLRAMSDPMHGVMGTTTTGSADD